MKAALSTLTAAMTRARLSAPAQDCTAAKDGTMNRPPAIARPARSIAMRMPCRMRTPARCLRRAAPATPAGRNAEIEREYAEQDRADQRRQQHDAPVREPGGEREPTAIAIEKTAR